MNAEGYDAFDDPYLYEGTTVLKNLLETRDAEALEAFELEMTALRAEEPLPDGQLDAAHYRSVHNHLFQDVYSWAGQDRTVRTGKGGNWFCFPEFIEHHMNALFTRLQNDQFLAVDTFEEFVQAAANFLAELNAIHPFREGNGRSQLTFLHLLAERAGHPLDMSRLDAAPFLDAMIESFTGNLEPLIAELTKLRAD